MAGPSNSRRIKDTGMIMIRISEVAFSLWAVLLIYSIYMLLSIANEIDTKKQQMTVDIMNNCTKCQNASNFVLSVQNNSTINNIIDTVNFKMSSMENMLTSIVDLGPQILSMYTNVKIGVYQSPNQALVNISTNGINTNNVMIQNQVNAEISSLNAAVENSFINTYLNMFNIPPFPFITPDSVIDIINSEVWESFILGHNYGFAYNTIPTIVAQTSQLKSLLIPPVNLGIPNIEFANYSIPYYNLTNLTSQLYIVQSVVNSTVFNNISSQQVMNDSKVVQIQEQHTSNFCDQFNTTDIEQIAANTQATIYAIIAFLGSIMAILFIIETCVIVNNNRDKPFKLITNPIVVKTINHSWYKTSITCLLIGLIGIAVYKYLDSYIDNAKQQYITNVIYPLQFYVRLETDNIGNTLDVSSVEFANSINNEINKIKNTFNAVQMTSTGQSVVDIQTSINNELSQNLTLLMPNFTPSACFDVVFNVPLSYIYSFLSNLNDFPVVTNDQLNIDVSFSQTVLSTSINSTLYQFEYYTSKFQSNIQIYYFLFAVGGVVLIFGTMYDLYHIHKHNKEKRQKEKGKGREETQKPTEQDVQSTVY
jgi:hypothetical protein